VVVTFCLAVIGWGIFRAENIAQAWDFISRMFVTAFDDFHPRLGSINTIVAVLILIIVVDVNIVARFTVNGNITIGIKHSRPLIKRSLLNALIDQAVIFFTHNGYYTKVRSPSR